jgi:hypothetical protein
MDFRIADTFTASLARLTGDEQKAAKTTAFDLQMNPAHPGLSFHKLEGRDKNFCSVRVSADIRLIVHRSEGSLLLCYVDHHDKAYAWAERRKLEVHPKTGAAQLVEIRETVKEIVVPRYVESPAPTAKSKSAKPAKQLFLDFSDDDLLGHGVPGDWLVQVRAITDQDGLLALIDHLPQEASEALLEMATGGRPTPPVRPEKPVNPFDHPDAQRRFRVLKNVDELREALDAPWDKWTIFLHPEQRQLVERPYKGPARVAGSAGTGKTIVALHRAVHLARTNPDARVLLATFSEPLANALKTKLNRLIAAQPRLGDRVDVCSLDALGLRLHAALIGKVSLMSKKATRDLIRDAAKTTEGHKFSLTFLVAEWEQVVDAWQLPDWESYREVARLGRKTRLPEAQRKILWSIMEKVSQGILAQGRSSSAGVFTALAHRLSESGQRAPYEFAVIDEAQDLGVPHLRFLGALGAGRSDALFFTGDLGQRIFQPPFSWKSLGVDVRGRSRTLRVNYRTSHQIRRMADRLLEAEVVDADGNKEERNKTVSTFNGPEPLIATFPSAEAERDAVARWLNARIAEGVRVPEIALFVRSAAQVDRAVAALKQTKLAYQVVDEDMKTGGDKAVVCTMHLAKGLEYRAVVVMACDDEVLPLQERIATVGDEGDLEETYITERQLLYVACTRARDHLLVTGAEPASEFLDDLRTG